MGFGVWGLGFGVWGLGFGVWGLGVWGFGGLGVWGFGGLGLGGVRFQGLWGLGFRVGAYTKIGGVDFGVSYEKDYTTYALYGVSDKKDLVFGFRESGH